MNGEKSEAEGCKTEVEEACKSINETKEARSSVYVWKIVLDTHNACCNESYIGKFEVMKR